MLSAVAISSAVGGITGMSAFTKAFVMLDFRETIVCTDGMRNADTRIRARSASMLTAAPASASSGRS